MADNENEKPSAADSQPTEGAQDATSASGAPQPGGASAGDSGSQSDTAASESAASESVVNEAPFDGESVETIGEAVDEAVIEGEVAEAEVEAAEAGTREDKLLDELQRLAAEYKNYRNRTEAQAIIERQRATGEVARRLFPIFDDLERAEQAGDLVEGSAFATIASKLRAVAEGLGLEHFGAAGEAFDPQLHEAVLQQTSTDVTELVIGQVVEPGYRIGDTLLRAAKVVVLAPAE